MHIVRRMTMFRIPTKIALLLVATLLLINTLSTPITARTRISPPASAARMFSTTPTSVHTPLTTASTHVTPSVASTMQSLPLSFVPNVGQWTTPVQFQAQALGGTVIFATDAMTLALPVLSASDIRSDRSSHSRPKHDFEHLSESSSARAVV